MKIYIILAVFSIIIALLIVTVFIVRNSNRSFDEEKKECKAVIVGYNSQTSSHFIMFDVKLIGREDESLYGLKGQYNVKNIKGETDYNYPVFEIGDEVYVYYREKKFLGLKYCEVRLAEEHY